jgi:hypothetical protein
MEIYNNTGYLKQNSRNIQSESNILQYSKVVHDLKELWN